MAIGGFEALVDYLADDYEIGCRLAAHGLKVELSEVVVETYSTGLHLTSIRGPSNPLGTHGARLAPLGLSRIDIHLRLTVGFAGLNTELIPWSRGYRDVGITSRCRGAASICRLVGRTGRFE